MIGKKSYFNRIYDRKLICAPWVGFKMRIFIRLYNWSHAAFCGARGGLPDEGAPTDGAPTVPAIESRAEYVIRRLALLNRCRDDDEMRFLDFYSCFNHDILNDIDSGLIDFRYARRMMNSALHDICKSLKEKSHE